MKNSSEKSKKYKLTLSRDRAKVLSVYRKLFEHFGPQAWWPVQRKIGDMRFEIAVGAILTQNTAWGNVEKAIRNLHSARAMLPQQIVTMNQTRLARLVRPTGYYNQKAKKLKIFSSWIIKNGGVRRIAHMPTDELRTQLLSIWGIGPETADSILLYAFGRPAFVVDAYTHRLCQTAGLGAMDYQECQRYFTDRLPRRVKLFNEYHALIVAWGKLYGNLPAGKAGKKKRQEAEKLLRLGR